MQIEILFEDEWLLMVNKPSGLPTQPTPDRQRANLYNELINQKKWPYLGLHHRLDAPTSGIIMLTKNRQANKGVSELFQGRNLVKNYYCLVQGQPVENAFEVQNHLKQKKFASGKSKMVSTQSGGDFAHTSFKTLELFSEATLIEATPHTGRMHQIRVHLHELGLPILGDSLYYRADRKFPRLMLHARSLIFQHPIHGNQLTIEAPLQSDFARTIERLRQST